MELCTVPNLDFVYRVMINEEEFGEDVKSGNSSNEDQVAWSSISQKKILVILFEARFGELMNVLT